MGGLHRECVRRGWIMFLCAMDTSRETVCLSMSHLQDFFRFSALRTQSETLQGGVIKDEEMKGKSFRMKEWGVSPDVQGREPPFH